MLQHLRELYLNTLKGPRVAPPSGRACATPRSPPTRKARRRRPPRRRPPRKRKVPRRWPRKKVTKRPAECVITAGASPAKRPANNFWLVAVIKLPRIPRREKHGLARREELRIATHIDRRLAAVVEHGDGGARQAGIGGTAAVRWRIALPQISRPLCAANCSAAAPAPGCSAPRWQTSGCGRAQGIRPGTCIAIASPPRKYKPKRKRRMASVSRRMESNRAAFPRQSWRTAGVRKVKPKSIGGRRQGILPRGSVAGIMTQQRPSGAAAARSIAEARRTSRTTEDRSGSRPGLKRSGGAALRRPRPRHASRSPTEAARLAGASHGRRGQRCRRLAQQAGPAAGPDPQVAETGAEAPLAKVPVARRRCGSSGLNTEAGSQPAAYR